MGDNNISHLGLASDQDDSGMTPRKFQGDLEADLELRNPQARHAPASALENSGFKHVLTQHNNTTPSGVSEHSRRLTTEVSFLDLLVCRENLDVRLIEAQRLFASMQYQKAKDQIEKLINEDNYYTDVIPLYCAVLIHLGQKRDLYSIAHKLVSADPDSAVSWFAVVSALSG